MSGIFRLSPALLFFTLTSLFVVATTARAETPSKPVLTVEEARQIADKWAQTTNLAGLRLGDIKMTSLVYVADLIENDDPSIHANHLVIRREDGFAALIYPAHNAPRLDREHRLGLDGLAGMSGMTGMTGARQSMRGSPVENDVQARQHLQRWLSANGADGYTLEDVVSMNAVFLIDMADRKTGKLLNQGIVRGTDGYVSMVRPIKLQQKSTAPVIPTFAAPKP